MLIKIESYFSYHSMFDFIFYLMRSSDSYFLLIGFGEFRLRKQTMIFQVILGQIFVNDQQIKITIKAKMTYINQIIFCLCKWQGFYDVKQFQQQTNMDNYKKQRCYRNEYQELSAWDYQEANVEIDLFKPLYFNTHHQQLTKTKLSTKYLKQCDQPLPNHTNAIFSNQKYANLSRRVKCKKISKQNYENYQYLESQLLQKETVGSKTTRNNVKQLYFEPFVCVKRKNQTVKREKHNTKNLNQYKFANNQKQKYENIKIANFQAILKSELALLNEHIRLRERFCLNIKSQKRSFSSFDRF